MLFSGYQACDDDMVAIARLRGQQLKTFDIPASCIYSLHEEEEVAWLKFGSFDGEFFQKVSFCFILFKLSNEYSN